MDKIIGNEKLNLLSESQLKAIQKKWTGTDWYHYFYGYNNYTEEEVWGDLDKEYNDLLSKANDVNSNSHEGSL